MNALLQRLALVLVLSVLAASCSDTWDHLAYVAQLTCDTTGQWLEVDLSMYEGHGMWFGSHDLPQGGGHMTDVCLAEGP